MRGSGGCRSMYRSSPELMRMRGERSRRTSDRYHESGDGTDHLNQPHIQASSTWTHVVAYPDPILFLFCPLHASLSPCALDKAQPLPLPLFNLKPKQDIHTPPTPFLTPYCSVYLTTKAGREGWGAKGEGEGGVDNIYSSVESKRVGIPRDRTGG